MPEQIAFVYTARPQGQPKFGNHGRILRLSNIHDCIPRKASIHDISI